MQSSSSRANERTVSRARTPVSVTDGDLAQVESRFDSLIPGSAWCGYGTCDAEGAQRLLIFVNLSKQRAMTITRFSDASHDLTGEDGAVWPDAALDGILNWLAKIGSTAE